MIAHDTRPSAVALVAAAGDGISCLGATARACGLLTTPQLHWMVSLQHDSNPLPDTAVMLVA